MDTSWTVNRMSSILFPIRSESSPNISDYRAPLPPKPLPIVHSPKTKAPGSGTDVP